MSDIFFQELKLPVSNYKLRIGGGGHGKQTGRMLHLIEDVLQKERPEVVLVEGDTNTVLAGALAAAKIGIKVGHIEAGLRSYDRTMPEELNRIVADHVSSYLFAPTRLARRILINEGIERQRIIVTGNTVADAIYQSRKIAARRSKILQKLGLGSQPYFLLTLHRPSNVDYKQVLNRILKGLAAVVQEFKLPIIFPIHPRTKKMLRRFKLKLPQGIRAIKPVGFFDFLILEESASLILTDSGGIQEEACILRVPCVTIRENTERPETLKVKASYLAGTQPGGIFNAVKIMKHRARNWSNPFGDGYAARRIVNHIFPDK